MNESLHNLPRSARFGQTHAERSILHTAYCLLRTASCLLRTAIPTLTRGAILLLLVLSACERERIVDPGPDTTPPLPPAGVLVEGARDGYIFIGWLRNSERDLRGYIVYRAEEDADGPYAAIDTITQNFIIDQQRSYDTTYHYFITAVDEAGNESIAIDTVSAESPNLSDPDETRNIAANGFNDGRRRLLRLSWVSVEEADLAGYRVYRSDTPFDDPSAAREIATTDAAFVEDSTDVQPGRRYYFAVVTIDRGGRESELSPLASDLIATRPVPVAPADNGQAPPYPQLSWLSVPEASRYLVSIALSETTGEVWSGYVSAGTDDTVRVRYSESPLTPGVTYYWRVSSVTAANGKPNGISDVRRFIVEN